MAAAVLVQVSVGDGAPDASPKLARIAGGFDRPVMALQAPGEPTRLYVVEQTGYVRILDRGQRRAKPFLDIHTRVSNGNEQGLLGIAFPPDYRTRKKVYANFTDRGGTTQVVELPVRNGVAVVGQARRLLEVAQPVDLRQALVERLARHGQGTSLGSTWASVSDHTL